MVLGGANANVRACFALQFSDQEDQTANTSCDGPFGSPDLDNTLVDFAKKHPVFTISGASASKVHRPELPSPETVRKPWPPHRE